MFTRTFPIPDGAVAVRKVLPDPSIHWFDRPSSCCLDTEVHIEQGVNKYRKFLHIKFRKKYALPHFLFVLVLIYVLRFWFCRIRHAVWHFDCRIKIH